MSYMSTLQDSIFTKKPLRPLFKKMQQNCLNCEKYFSESFELHPSYDECVRILQKDKEATGFDST